MALLPALIRLISLLTLAQLAFAQTTVELEAFIPRTTPEMRPQIEGRHVVVQGTVSGRLTDLREYALLSIQNHQGTGLAIEAPATVLQEFVSGDQLEIEGVAGHRAGLPVLRPGSIRRIGKTAAPLPQRVSLA